MNSQNPFNQFDNAYMASLNNAYREAQSLRRTGTMPMLPEGKYQCIVSAFSLKPSKNYPDELNLMLGFEVISGDQKGITAYKFYAINPESVERLKTDMQILNIDLEDDISVLGEFKTADAILDQIVDITVKHKRKENGTFFQNIYLNRSMGKASVNGFQPVEDDDELPFE